MSKDDVLVVTLHSDLVALTADRSGLWSELLGFFQQLPVGSFERLETIALVPSLASDVIGLVLVYAEASELDHLRRSDDFETLLLKLTKWVSGVGVQRGRPASV